MSALGRTKKEYLTPELFCAGNQYWANSSVPSLSKSRPISRSFATASELMSAPSQLKINGSPFPVRFILDTTEGVACVVDVPPNGSTTTTVADMPPSTFKPTTFKSSLSVSFHEPFRNKSAPDKTHKPGISLKLAPTGELLFPSFTTK